MKTRKQHIESIIEGMRAIKRKLVICGSEKSSLKKSKKMEITPSQWTVLSIIMERDGIGIGIKEIAGKLGMTSSAATQLVDGLVEHGYLIRKNSKEDRRAVLLEISTKHRKKMSDMKKKAVERFTMIFSTLNNKELETYAKLHQKINNET